ncbi:hypothetical protein [Parasulfitobacter algicola]|uniref:Uncharacterized protein n=1 Tax=Parasulfitobacter algicola TaxID=2614809 RepID=A0ABX2IR26_9RHOB|nr:hypothetical protein [Sulfitobacter algicola]NSX55337.1 hypothetical protein [Sulfitobacter algicola]
MRDLPMHHGTYTPNGVATDKAAMHRQHMHGTMSYTSGLTYLLSIPAGAFVFSAIFYVIFGMPAAGTLIGVILTPILLFWRARRAEKKWQMIKSQQQYTAQEDRRKQTARQIQEAKARGDFDRFGQTEK